MSSIFETPEPEKQFRQRLATARNWALGIASCPCQLIVVFTLLSIGVQLALLVYTPAAPGTQVLFLLYFLTVKCSAWWTFIVSFVYAAETIDSGKLSPWKQLGFKLFADHSSRSAYEQTMANQILFYETGEMAMLVALLMWWKVCLLWIFRWGMIYPEMDLSIHTCLAILYCMAFVPLAVLVSTIAWIVVSLSLGFDRRHEASGLDHIDDELWGTIDAHQALLEEYRVYLPR